MTAERSPVTFSVELQLATDEQVRQSWQQRLDNGNDPETVAIHRQRFESDPGWMPTWMDLRFGRVGEMGNLEHEARVVWHKVTTDFHKSAEEQAKLALQNYCEIARDVDDTEVWPEEVWPQDVFIRVDTALIDAARVRASQLAGGGPD